MVEALQTALAAHPRVDLTRTPTPLQHLRHLSVRLGVDVFIKRDDLTDLALGGDKPRKLEYELARARDEGATVLVTCGSAQSNHARLTTAAARTLGLGCEVVLSRDEYTACQGNLLTVYLMGATVHLVEANDHWQLESHVHTLCDRLRSQGQAPYYVPVSGTTPHSCLGYVRGGLELVAQLDALKITPHALYAPFGTGGTFVAMLLALRASHYRALSIGVSVNRDRGACHDNFEHWWAALASLLDYAPPGPREPYEIHDQFVGRQYGDPTAASLEAISLMAETEGILLDPVYSGKTFAALVAHVAAGRWQGGQRVVLLHTGGTPALFAYHEAVRAHLQRRGRSCG